MEFGELVNKQSYDFDDLCEIIRILRSENGCPWDREQTHESIRKNLIEETYEVVEAIDTDDSALLCEELGDLMLQVVFHSKMAEEERQFDINDVCDGICKKLIVRHPHIFSDTRVKTSAEVLKNWEEIKRRTKAETRSSAIDGIPPSLPSLMRASKASKKMYEAGFGTGNVKDVALKICGEAAKLNEAAGKGDKEGFAAAMGGLLFSAANASRLMGADAEETLGHSVDFFTEKFRAMEEEIKAGGRTVKELTDRELEEIWDRLG